MGGLEELAQYIRHGSKHVAGWLFRVDGQLFLEILTYQRAAEIRGAVAEIGVHHGRSFIPLCLGLRGDESAYAIDIFDDQAKNLDRSGHGDRDRFEANLRRYGIDKNRVVVDARASDEVTPQDVLAKVGRVRFFSVDGGHWREIVSSDLKLAASVLSDSGVIALDDFMRPEWPDVSLGLFDWFETSDKSIRPFAIGYNKLYLCRDDQVTAYQLLIEQSDFLRAFRSKFYKFLGTDVPVMQSFQLAEWGMRERLVAYLKLYHPDLYVSLQGKSAR
jgi:hypothetical protein